MDQKLDYEEFLSEISEEIRIILDAPHIRHSKSGIYVRIYNLNDERIISASFGKLQDEIPYQQNAVKNIAYVLNSGKKEIIPGVIFGKNHIVSVSGLAPNDNSVTGVFILTCIEDTDQVSRLELIKEMGCYREMCILNEHRLDMTVIELLPEMIEDLFKDILKMNHIGKQNRTGFVLRIYEKKSGDLIERNHVGILSLQSIEEFWISAHVNAHWLFKNHDAIASIEGGDPILAGAISGRKYIVSVDGLDPNDNSCISVFVLAVLENLHKDINLCREYIERAACVHEMYSFVSFLTKICNRVEIKEKFGWVLSMFEN